MTKERFELTSGKDLMWTVKDNESKVKIEFREGLFNETQVGKVPRDIDVRVEGDAMKLARIMREIGDWIAENHAVVALCDWRARRSAIWKLSKEKYWLAMAAATNTLCCRNWIRDTLLVCRTPKCATGQITRRAWT